MLQARIQDRSRRIYASVNRRFLTHGQRELLVIIHADRYKTEAEHKISSFTNCRPYVFIHLGDRIRAIYVARGEVLETTREREREREPKREDENSAPWAAVVN